MAQHIEIVGYDPAWEEKFNREARLIEEIFGGELVAIHHIGSTAVKGLAAKPIIDIMPVVKDVSRADGFNARFEEIGYEAMGEFGIAGRRYFRKGGDERTHQLHIFGVSSEKDIARHLAVRDYLRAHPQTAEKYGELKRALAARFPYDIESYCDGKAAFMKELEKAALKFYGK